MLVRRYSGWSAPGVGEVVVGGQVQQDLRPAAGAHLGEEARERLGLGDVELVPADVGVVGRLALGLRETVDREDPEAGTDGLEHPSTDEARGPGEHEAGKGVP